VQVAPKSAEGQFNLDGPEKWWAEVHFLNSPHSELVVFLIGAGASFGHFGFGDLEEVAEDFPFSLTCQKEQKVHTSTPSLRKRKWPTSNLVR
jgi:hypothetical protein